MRVQASMHGTVMNKRNVLRLLLVVLLFVALKYWFGYFSWHDEWPAKQIESETDPAARDRLIRIKALKEENVRERRRKELTGALVTTALGTFLAGAMFLKRKAISESQRPR